MLEKFGLLVMLYDFYGPLLTERQQQAVELHYEDDLSLSEVAAIMGITRQAVFDLLKRTEKTLEEYERRLRLFEKFSVEREQITRAVQILEGLEPAHEPAIARVVKLLQGILSEDGTAEGS
ncbi:MAG: YlxM family DNA-binding protein [Solirubrobacterales bacterium]